MEEETIIYWYLKPTGTSKGESNRVGLRNVSSKRYRAAKNDMPSPIVDGGEKKKGKRKEEKGKVFDVGDQGRSRHQAQLSTD